MDEPKLTNEQIAYLAYYGFCALTHVKPTAFVSVPDIAKIFEEGSAKELSPEQIETALKNHLIANTSAIITPVNPNESAT